MASSSIATLITVGWIAPMSLELTPAVILLEQHATTAIPGDQVQYHTGRIGGNWVAMAVCPRIGTHPATSVLANMRRSFPNIKHVLVVGIAGGMPSYGPSSQEQIVLGDVVVSCPQWSEGGVAHYEFGAWEGRDRLTASGHTLHPSTALLTAVNLLQTDHMKEPGTKIPQFLHELRAGLRKVEQPQFDDPGPDYDYLFPDDYPHLEENILCKDLCDFDRSARRRDRGSKARREKDVPHIHYGTIGSANTLVISSAKRNDLYKEYGAICFEMESAGVMSEYQALVIRGICDYADSHKNKQWQKYAAATAAAYAKEVLLLVPPAVPDERAGRYNNGDESLSQLGPPRRYYDNSDDFLSQLERASSYYKHDDFRNAYNAYKQARSELLAHEASSSHQELFEVHNRMALCLLNIYSSESGHSPDYTRREVWESLDQARELSFDSEKYGHDAVPEYWAMVTQLSIRIRRAEVKSPGGRIDSVTLEGFINELEELQCDLEGLHEAGCEVDELLAYTRLRKSKLGAR